MFGACVVQAWGSGGECVECIWSMRGACTCVEYRCSMSTILPLNKNTHKTLIKVQAWSKRSLMCRVMGSLWVLFPQYVYIYIHTQDPYGLLILYALFNQYMTHTRFIFMGNSSMGDINSTNKHIWVVLISSLCMVTCYWLLLLLIVIVILWI